VKTSARHAKSKPKHAAKTETVKDNQDSAAAAPAPAATPAPDATPAPATTPAPASPIGQ
jgi:hypothetical protein